MRDLVRVWPSCESGLSWRSGWPPAGAAESVAGQDLDLLAAGLFSGGDFPAAEVCQLGRWSAMLAGQFGAACWMWLRNCVCYR